jgi:hypothetical protein
MLYIILIVNLSTPLASYCTKPDTLDNTKTALLQTLTWYQTHRGYGPARIIRSDDVVYTNAINGYVMTDAANPNQPIAVPPCRDITTEK